MHHLQPRCDGGENTLESLITRCTAHQVDNHAKVFGALRNLGFREREDVLAELRGVDDRQRG